MNRGKEICEKLKAIRKNIAERYGIAYEPAECNHQGDCAGTCPQCDAELKDLQQQLEKRGIHIIDSMFKIEPPKSTFITFKKNIDRLEGFVCPSPGSNNTFSDDDDDDDCLPGRVVDDEPFEDEPETVTFRKKRVLYKECQIAGITFHDLTDIWDELEEGSKLALVRHKDNKYDKYAVAVTLAGDYDGDPDNFDFDFILGYVPKTENKEIATMMDMGWDEVFECEVSRIVGNNPYRGRIDISIYIVSKNEEISRNDNSIRAIKLNDDEYKKTTDDIKTKGYTYFRWGGFPPWENNLPEKGEKIVLMHKEQNNTTLYLLHCIADNDNDAAYFTQDKNGNTDDCNYYVFTNVKGPLSISNDELYFMLQESINSGNDNNPEKFLSEYASTRLKEIIGIE